VPAVIRMREGICKRVQRGSKTKKEEGRVDEKRDSKEFCLPKKKGEENRVSTSKKSKEEGSSDKSGGNSTMTQTC